MAAVAVPQGERRLAAIAAWLGRFAKEDGPSLSEPVLSGDRWFESLQNR